MVNRGAKPGLLVPPRTAIGGFAFAALPGPFVCFVLFLLCLAFLLMVEGLFGWDVRVTSVCKTTGFLMKVVITFSFYIYLRKRDWPVKAHTTT